MLIHNFEYVVKAAVILGIVFAICINSVNNTKCICYYAYTALSVLCAVLVTINIFVDVSDIVQFILWSEVAIALITYIIDIAGIVIYMLNVENERTIKVYLCISRLLLGESDI